VSTSCGSATLGPRSFEEAIREGTDAALALLAADAH
jgi:hypothetical protein